MTILIVGDANADVGAALSRFPREGDDSSVKVLAWGSGGAGVNVATALALLGAPARLLARVGQDPAADVALRAAREGGVDCSFVQVDPRTSTGLCYAAVSPGGERTFFSYRGANMVLDRPPFDDLFRDVTWLHIGGHALLEGSQKETTEIVLKEASRRGVPASLDLCLPLVRARPGVVIDLAPSLSLLFANQPELAALSASGVLVDLGAPDPVDAALATIAAVERAISVRVVGKLGARGSVLGGDSPVVVPGIPIAEALDTTGCGDAFVAAFLTAQTRGAQAFDCARLGNAVGALVASRPGAAEVLPSLGELLAFLSARGEVAPFDTLFSDERERESESARAPKG
jgi:sugar/nucleoside kinase (ribokinase family)